MSLFNELKRRNVFRVGAAYLVVAWLLIQIVDTLSDMLSMPDAFGRGVLILLAIGFPITLIVSWVFELTPEGIQTQAEADESGFKTSKSKLNAVFIGGLMLAVIFLVVDNYVIDSSDAVSEPVALEITAEPFQGEITQTVDLEKSIAVLPFDNLSDDASQEYFADGLTEELLNKLAQIDDLQVTGRTSSFYFKDRNEDLREIGQQLGVNFLLEGSVRKGGDTVRVTAQLIQADNGFHLWSDTFDRSLEDIFAIQDEIAEAVTTALSVTLGAGEFNQPGSTRNLEAYEEMLQGVAQFYLFTPESLLLAIEHLERAVFLDPEFGQAWISLSSAYEFGFSTLPQEQSVNFISRSLEALQQAKNISNDIPLLLGVETAYLRSEGNWLEASSLLENYFATNGDTGVISNRAYGRLLLEAGRLQEAVPYLERARRLDPLDEVTNYNLIMTYTNLGRFDQALETVRLARGFESLYSVFSLVEWNIFFEMEEWDTAWTMIDDFYEDESNANDQVFSQDFYSSLKEILENPDKETAIQDLQQLASQSSIPLESVYFKWWPIYLGYPEIALQYQMERGVDEGLWFPSHTAFRQLPEFKDWMDEVGLVDYWRTTGNWADKGRPLEGSDDFECF